MLVGPIEPLSTVCPPSKSFFTCFQGGGFTALLAVQIEDFNVSGPDNRLTHSKHIVRVNKRRQIESAILVGFT